MRLPFLEGATSGLLRAMLKQLADQAQANCLRTIAAAEWQGGAFNFSKNNPISQDGRVDQLAQSMTSDETMAKH